MKEINRWLEENIIGLNLCPFAKKIVGTPLFPIHYSAALTQFEAQDKFLEVLDLMQSEELPSALIVFEDWSLDFEDFNDFTQAMNEILEEIDLSDHVMAIGFHPEFRVANEPEGSFAHWPNSSPYPLIHLLAHEEIKKVTHLILGDEISRVNEERIKNLSPSERKKFWPWKFS